MPYSTPAPSPAPLPVHSLGRPGHRRSFSEMAHNDYHNIAASSSKPTSGAFAPLGALPRRRPVSFHLAADDEDDDSSPEDEAGSNTTRTIPTTTLCSVRPTLPGRPSHLPDDEDDEQARGLPPLKLKIPNGSLNLPFSGSPTTSAPNTLPFPRTISPPRSRTASTDALAQVRAPSPSLYSPGPRSATATRSESPRPDFPRNSSTPVFLSSASANGARILLSNGKPLKSSLKSSSSSPNIPFPSQSLVPSRIYAEIAAAAQQQSEAEEHGGQLDRIHRNNRHARAASAPALPSLMMVDDDDVSASAPSSPPTPSVPKAVHFPSSDDGALATVKFFKRTARPASVSLPGASGGEETETETDGEGYNSGTGTSGVYSGYNANTSGGGWGWGGYVNPWDRYTAAGAPPNTGRGPGGYPFPRIAAGAKSAASSPLAQRQQQQQHPKPPLMPNNHAQGGKATYELDPESTSEMPRRELSLFDNVFLEGVELSSMPEEGGKSQQVTLTASLLVRNLAYEKHVSVRFTLDEWHTTSEVKAAYKESLERLPEKWVSAMHGERSTAEDGKTGAAPVNPQWDRFGFCIDLSDYARSRSLVTRTLWMVVRFAVPGTVRVPIAVPLLSSAALSKLPATSTHNATLDVLSPSDGDMLSTLISGVAGAPHHDGAAQERYAKGRSAVEELLRRKGVCVGVGVGTEWWDNNGMTNFRVGFTVALAGAAEQEAAEVQSTDREVRKRANVISLPTPPPMSILGTSLSHSSLSPPQISVSTSLDSASNNNNTNGSRGYNSNMVISSLSLATSSYPANDPPAANNNGNGTTMYGGPTTNSGSPKPWPTRTPAANKAMAETTLERLKRLNLRNYAAPAAVRSSPATPPARITISSDPLPNLAGGVTLSIPGSGPPSRTSSTSSTSSASSWGSGGSGSEVTPMTSPLSTPTVGSVDVKFGLGGEKEKVEEEDGQKNVEEKEELEPSLGRATPRPTLARNSTVRPSASVPVPISRDINSNNDEVTTPEMLPPLFGAFMSGPGGSFDFGNGREGDGGASVMGTSPPFSMLGGGGEGTGGFGRGAAASLSLSSPPTAAYSTAISAANRSAVVAGDNGNDESGTRDGMSGESTPTPAGVRPLPMAAKSLLLLDNIREKSTGSGRSSPVPGVMGRGLGKTGSGSDSGSSKSGSGSGASKSGSGSGSGGGRHSHHRQLRQPQQKPLGSGLGLVFKPVSSGSSSGTASSLSSSPSPPGSLNGGSGAGRKQWPGARSPTFAPITTTSSPPPSNSAVGDAGSDNNGQRNSLDDIRDPDSIYQAFVRQWCFASGPAPAQAGGFGTMNGSPVTAGAASGGGGMKKAI